MHACMHACMISIIYIMSFDFRMMQSWQVPRLALGVMMVLLAASGKISYPYLRKKALRNKRRLW